MMNKLSNIDVFILCGGLGKRLRSEVGEFPKVMADVDGRPFLDMLLDYFCSLGFKRAVLGTGYKAEIIEQYYEQNPPDCELVYSKEEEPLGTGGAVKYVEPHIQSDYFFVLNGDSFCRLDYKKFFDFHHQNDAIASIAVTEVSDQSDYGSITLDAEGKIIAFEEKIKSSGPKYVNAGIYCFSKKVFDFMPKEDVFSIEKDFFPSLVSKSFYGFQIKEKFFDIGTPERYHQAKKELTE